MTTQTDPYDYEAERIRSVEHWESLRPWFKEQGYFLYKNVDEGDKKYEYAAPTIDYPDTPIMSFNDTVEDPFPYAFMGPGDMTRYTGRPRYSTRDSVEGPARYAQDSRGRHVAIKMLKTENEYKVLRLLKDQPRLQDPHFFPSIIPILDLLEYNGGNRFAVMPRWELNINHKTFFPTFHIAIQYLISLLEGLAFLHELRIFNRDICMRNTLVNHISSTWPSSLSQTEYHQHLKSIGALRYAIMDFDLAMILNEKTYGPNPRLPIGLVEKVGGRGARPYETIQAYIDFDPFKHDVACLGIHFSDYFTQIIPDVPLLAPLIDRMITSDIDKRFTASEALAFARNVVLPTTLSLGPIQRKPRLASAYLRIDRWAGLPESFIAEWGSYREDYFSWTMRFQNWVFFERPEWEWYLILYARYIMRVVTWVPRFISRYLRRGT